MTVDESAAVCHRESALTARLTMESHEQSETVLPRAREVLYVHTVFCVGPCLALAPEEQALLGVGSLFSSSGCARVSERPEEGAGGDNSLDFGDGES